MIHALCVAWAVAPQTVLARYTAPIPVSNPGASIAVLDDLDGDGTPEVALGAASPVIQVVSGATGAVVYSVQSWLPSSFSFADAIEVIDDLDADGVDDFVLSEQFAPPSISGAVAAYSARTGAMLWRTPGGTNDRFGWTMRRIGDFDSDGIADVLVGAPGGGQPSPGKLAILSGASGAVLRTHALLGSIGLGLATTSLPDIDGDGFEDLLTVDTVGWVPHALSGNTGAVLWSAGAGLSATPRAMRRCDDVDGDGLADVIIPLGDFALNTQRVRCVSSAAGVLLWTRPATAIVEEGTLLDDFDLDGVRDVALSESMYGFPGVFLSGVVRVVSGRDGQSLFNVYGQRPFDWYSSVALAWDANGDGRRDVLIGKQGPTSATGGAVLVSYDPALGGVVYCAGAPNSVGAGATLTGASASGFSVLANDLTMHAAGVPPGALMLLLSSREQGPPVALPGSAGQLCLGANLGRHVSLTTFASAQGTASFAVNLQAVASPYGAEVARGGDQWLFQALYRDRTAGGASTTNLTDAWRVTLRD